jgi:tetratricopeptide (TPR) repeat protein
MRATLADASLIRYAGRFVWLELDFDNPANQQFLARHGVSYTPSFFVLDPGDEHAAATQLGAMSLPELLAFLDRGEASFLAKTKTPADAALAQGDALLGLGQSAAAAARYREAVSLGGSNWPERGRALGSFTWALMLSKQWQPCAEMAAAEAVRMARGPEFGRIVLSGLVCVKQAQSAPWVAGARQVLEPVAAEAIALPSTVRDHRFQLYQQLMHAAEMRADKATVSKWGDLWLVELDATSPANDDERSALDVARVDAAAILGDPARVLPALVASERAMPDNYNASLRLAQMEIDARKYDEGIAACDRGLAHVTGPLARSWLLQAKADALMHKGDLAVARRVLQDALQAAESIGVKQNRDSNIERIQRVIRSIDEKAAGVNPQ